VHRPRPDREVLEISGDNAQAVLSPNACVFVAKWVTYIGGALAINHFTVLRQHVLTTSLNSR
jgi:hypothetical protein